MTGPEEQRTRWQRICAVLDAALDAPAADRARIVAEHCRDAPGLRAEVEALLAAESTTDVRVDTPAMDWAGGILDQDAPPPAHAPGERIGAYRLVRELGRGGMGAVWLAERAGDGFEQQVALKLLKRGLDTDAIIERFLDERRILAGLRHPHIALLLDGGVSGQGQPWFTMEWVDGQRITDWCDTRRLGPRDRVVLFLDAIAAVQYAHQQLVVHRDLKPGNVMVTIDGQVKLLDFGIARMLDVTGASAEAATLTRMGWRMLTPEYAAPEQLRGEPASTATDVHALGVLLYELLAGCRPAPAGERTGLPPRPSTQVTDAAATPRGGSRVRIRRTLQGDLDTIVLKALHPEPARRYGTAQALGDDLQRWLDGQPVAARPDGAWYRTRRFVSRHRWGVAAATVVALSLAGGALVAAWKAREARQQAQWAEQQTREAEKQAQRAEQVKDFLTRVLAQSDPDTWRDRREPTVSDVLEAGTRFIDDEFDTDRGLHAELLATLGDIHRSRGAYDAGEALVRRSLHERTALFGNADPAVADSLYKLSAIEYDRGRWKEALDAATRAAAIFEKTLGDDPRTALAYEGVAHAYVMGSKRNEGIGLFRKALAIYRKSGGESSFEVARTEQTLGHLLAGDGDVDEGVAMLRHAVAVNRRLSGPRSMRYASSLVTQALGLITAGDQTHAAVSLAEAADIYRGFGAHGEAGLGTALTNLADVQMLLGRFAASEASQREALALSREGPKAGTRWEALQLRKLASTLGAEGKVQEAEASYLASIRIMERDAGVDHSWLPIGLLSYASFLHFHGRHEEARTYAVRTLDLFRRQGGAESLGALGAQGLLARIRFSQGDREGGLALANQVLVAVRRSRPSDTRTADAFVELVSELQLQSGSVENSGVEFRRLAAEYRQGGNTVAALRNQTLYGASLALLGDARCERVLRDALAATVSLYGPRAGHAGRARMYLGTCLQATNDVVEAVDLIQRGRRDFVREFGERHAVVAMADDALAGTARVTTRARRRPAQ